jgi:hypothetical protein
MERDAEQPALTTVADLALDVEEWLREQLPVLDDSDATWLLDDE